VKESVLALMLELVRAGRDFINISRKLGLSYTDVGNKIAEIEATREFTVQDAKEFLDRAGAAIDKLDHDLGNTPAP